MRSPCCTAGPGLRNGPRSAALVAIYSWGLVGSGGLQIPDRAPEDASGPSTEGQFQEAILGAQYWG